MNAHVTRLRRLLPACAVLLVLAPPDARGQEAPTAAEESVFEIPEDLNPVQEASQLYASGLRHVKQARKLEEKLAQTADPKKQAKTQEKIDQAYASAVEELVGAIGANPRMHEAYFELAEVMRHTGDHAKALQAYNGALHIEPDDMTALRGRGESLLRLGYVEDAKADCARLLAAADPSGPELLEVMNQWVFETLPSITDPASRKALAELADWIRQQNAS